MSSFRKLLLPISWIWGLVAAIRHKFYDVGIFKTYRVNIPVISIGNIAVGGTGKTPLVIFLAKQFLKKRIAILARGYGDGDEMKVIRRHLPHALLYIGADRVVSARKAVQDGAELIFLDDGFQHRRLHRDLDVVIARPKDYKDQYLPAGDLRDSPKRLQKVEVISGYEIIPKCPVSLQGVRVGIFCGIGNPERFKKTVEDLGAIIVSHLFLGDHEPIGKKRLERFHLQCNALNAKYLICTEKDEVKLEKNDLPIHAVQIEIKNSGFDPLIEKIGQIL